MVSKKNYCFSLTKDIKPKKIMKISWIVDFVVLSIIIIVVSIMVNTLFKKEIVLIDSIAAVPAGLILIHLFLYLIARKNLKKAIMENSEKALRSFLEEDIKKMGFKDLVWNEKPNLQDIQEFRPHYVNKHSIISMLRGELTFKKTNESIFMNSFQWRVMPGPGQPMSKWFASIPNIVSFTKEVPYDKLETVFILKDMKNDEVVSKIPSSLKKYMEAENIKKTYKDCVVYRVSNGHEFLSFRTKFKILRGEYKGFIRWSLNPEEFVENIVNAIIKDYERKFNELLPLLKIMKSI